MLQGIYTISQYQEGTQMCYTSEKNSLHHVPFSLRISETIHYMFVLRIWKKKYQKLFELVLSVLFSKDII